jgi:hypothetical protein
MSVRDLFDNHPVRITFLSARQFHLSPQVGRFLDRTWGQLRTWLSKPRYADRKDAHGAWTSCAIPDGRIKGADGSHCVIAMDIDHCVEGDLDRTARVFARRRGVVVPTFSASTGDKPDAHRVVLLTSRMVLAKEFSLVWVTVAGEFARSGIVVDKSCRNPNRLYFATVAKSPESWMGVRYLDGDPIDVDALLPAAREAAEREAEERARQPLRLPPMSRRSRDLYIAAAFKSARDRILNALDGTKGEGRHAVLLREAWSLSRLVSEDEVRDGLLETFVQAAGEERREEGERAIGDGVRARRERDAS